MEVRNVAFELVLAHVPGPNWSEVNLCVRTGSLPVLQSSGTTPWLRRGNS